MQREVVQLTVLGQVNILFEGEACGHGGVLHLEHFELELVHFFAVLLQLPYTQLFEICDVEFLEALEFSVVELLDFLDLLALLL